MMVVGLTGNLASGKSEAARIFRKLGAKIVDADLVAKKLTKKGTPIFKAILKIFGGAFLDKKKELDRRKLAWHVFSHPKDLKKLNILIHPGVIVEAYKAIEKEKGKEGILVLDVPLLFESRMEKLADVTVLIKSRKEILLDRSVSRGVPKELAIKILSSQWQLSKKEKLADYVIENNGTAFELEQKIKKVYEQILSVCSKSPRC